MYNMGLMTFACWLLIFFEGASSIRDVSLEVQPYPVIKDETAALICRRDMQGANLYSVKWYRGSHEFYRYTPSEVPKNQVFGLPGIYVDMNQSDGDQVFLRRLDLSLAGNFSCEVTAEAPLFSTQVDTKFIDIIVKPVSPPVLKPEKEHYKPGEMLRAICTSSPSHPASNLTMKINDTPLRSSVTSLHPSESGFFWTSIAVELQLSPELFVNDLVRLTCVSKVYNVYTNETKFDILSPRAKPRPERITLGGGAPRLCLQSWLLVCFHLVFLLMVFGQVYLHNLDFSDLLNQ